MSSQYSLTFDETKSGRGRPKNLAIVRLMHKESISRATAFRRLKAKREAQLKKAAKLGNGVDHLNQHPEGFYRTPARGTWALLTRESFSGAVWECACGDGAISVVLEAAGLTVVSTDLVFRGYGRGDHDFLADHERMVDHVVTNPPYSPPRFLAEKFVEHALTRIRPGGTVCMLLPLYWGAAQRRQHLMAKCMRKYVFSRRLPMHRGGYTGKIASPPLNVAWYVFKNEHSGGTIEVVLPPDCGEETPATHSHAIAP